MKKQAILIIAHNNLWTLKKLIECLDSDYFDIYVHIDKKSDIDIKKIKNITKKSKMYTYKNIDVSWGDISQIETEMFLLKESSTNYDYKYYHLISGNDFPIESADKIYNFFNMNYPKEYVDFASKELPSNKDDYYYYKNFFMKKYKKRKIAKVFNHILLDFQKKFKLKINQNINFKVGANWFSITDKLCKYILEKEKMVENIFRYSRSGDESFLQTLVYDSRFVENLYDKKCENNPVKSCKRLIDWNRGTPYIFKSDDYDEIVNSKCFFVRKVDENIDKKLIKKLYKHIYK